MFRTAIVPFLALAVWGSLGTAQTTSLSSMIQRAFLLTRQVRSISHVEPQVEDDGAVAIGIRIELSDRICDAFVNVTDFSPEDQVRFDIFDIKNCVTKTSSTPIAAPFDTAFALLTHQGSEICVDVTSLSDRGGVTRTLYETPVTCKKVFREEGN